MAFQEIKNVKIVGIAAAVPSKVVENSESGLFQNQDEFNRFVETTGIERRHIVENGVCASDLCFEAAEKLITELNWDKNEVDCLIFVSQTPDYKLPATSCILQSKLGLSRDCMAFDISLGCSGWVYGITNISALVSSGHYKKALLLVGDTVSTTKSPLDKSTYPLFGDAGTATAIEYSENAKGIKSALYTDGSNFDAIIIEDGGARNPVNPNSFEITDYGNGIVRNRLQSILDGSSVFTFAISKAPQSINKLLDYYSIDKNSIDFFVFHQANLFMNEKIRNKLQLPENKVPYILNDYGNTSSTSIPLTMVVKMKNSLINSQNQIVACAFGVGLSWGSVWFETKEIVCCDLIVR